MAGLAETTARLARNRRQRSASGPAVTAGMAEVADFGPNPGALRMLAWAPADLPLGAPLVVVLHGCGQDAEAFAAQAGWLTLAERLGFAVIAPEQSGSNNFNRCFNWFEPGDIGRGGGEAESIAAMVRHAIMQGADPDRVYVTGLSAGGAMAVVMLAAYPELFAAGAVVAGLPYAVASGVGEALGAMHGRSSLSAEVLGERVRAAAPAGGPIPRIAIWQGDADHTVVAGNATALLGQWAAAHGLDAGAAEVEQLLGRTRLRLRAPGSATVLVESNIVEGLGHGTPLSTIGPEALGATAPYMLEAGVSSSLEIAGFWGLAQPPAAGLPAVRTTPVRPATAASPGLGDQVLSAVSPHVSPAVREVIAKAMQAAGLKR